jgi:hypothetical protein
MTLFQISSIASFTLLLGLLTGRLYWLVRPKLTPATTVLFISLVCLCLIPYFGILATFKDQHASSQANLRLDGIAYNGLLCAIVLFIGFGLLAFLLMLIEFFNNSKSRPKL